MGRFRGPHSFQIGPLWLLSLELWEWSNISRAFRDLFLAQDKTSSIHCNYNKRNTSKYKYNFKKPSICSYTKRRTISTFSKLVNFYKTHLWSECTLKLFELTFLKKSNRRLSTSYMYVGVHKYKRFGVYVETVCMLKPHRYRRICIPKC